MDALLIIQGWRSRWTRRRWDQGQTRETVGMGSLFFSSLAEREVNRRYRLRRCGASSDQRSRIRRKIIYPPASVLGLVLMMHRISRLFFRFDTRQNMQLTVDCFLFASCQPNLRQRCQQPGRNHQAGYWCRRRCPLRWRRASSYPQRPRHSIRG